MLRGNIHALRIQGSDVEIGDPQGVLLDEFATRLDAGDSVAGQIAQLRGELSALGTRLAGLDSASGLQGLAQRVQSVEQSVRSVNGQVETLSTRLTALDARTSRGLLFVEAGEGRAFSVAVAASRVSARTGSGPAASGVSRGLYWLAPGTYRVAGANLTAQSITIGAGEAFAVTLTRNVVVQ